MNLNQSSRRPSILRASQPQGEKQKKRASFSDEVMNADAMRRASGLSMPASDHTTDESNKSNETFDYFPKTSSGNHRHRPDAYRMTNKSDSTVSSRSAQPTCFPFNEKTFTQMKKLVSSKFWKVLINCFTLILIFGGSLQNFFSVAADPYFVILFFITFGILTIDIVMMCYTTPLYFVFRPSMKLKKRGDDIGCMCFAFQIGSFNFWFDIISVLSIVWELSQSTWTNVMREVVINVNDSGLPLDIQSPNTLALSPLVFSILFSTARVARFLRAEYVTALQSLTTGVAKLICRRNVLDKSGSFGRKFFKDSQNDTIGEKRWEEMHEAATKIQRAWKNQSTLDGIRAFQIALSTTKSQRIPSFRGNSFRIDEDLANQQHPSNGRRRHLRQNSSRASIKGMSTREMMKKDSLKKLGFIKKTRYSEDSSTLRKDKKKKKKSQIGSAMNEMTMRRVAVGMMITISVAAIFSYAETSKSNELTVLSIHNTVVNLYQSDQTIFANNNINETDKFLASFLSSVSSCPSTYVSEYVFYAEPQNHDEKTNPHFSKTLKSTTHDVREWQKTLVQVCQDYKDENNVTHECGMSSKAMFVHEQLAAHHGWVALTFIFFLLLVWSIGLLFFVGPVTTLVVYPIERMIRLLSMLVKDPLGYSKTKKYRQFVREDDELASNTTWTRECLNGMETSFLMSTILRIGSLMKVGFGSAGVEIIRSNLQKNNRQSITLSGSSKRIDSTVACIFMFCDIRGFTDSSECLNEEVFVFTNRIAAVVHSYCHAYGGSANKNIGDAFLLSWQLDNHPTHTPGEKKLYASKRQADKALFSVVKICIALCYENFFLEGLSAGSISALKRKFAKRPGNLVQLGFGLHAGKAVEGAIGSQRKLDATYLSEAVELADFLEASTKKYGVNVVMSGKFYSLLHKSVREKCRKIDHISFTEQYEKDDLPDDGKNDSYMSLHTFDMDIDSLFNKKNNSSERSHEASHRRRKGSIGSYKDDRLRNSGTANLTSSFLTFRRMSMMGHKSQESIQARYQPEDSFRSTNGDDKEADNKEEKEKKLEIPDGNLMYSHKVWHQKELLVIRKKFTPAFYERFNAGYEAYIRSDWKKARRDFESMVSKYNDQPSQVFLDKMNELNDKPPRDFVYRYDDFSKEYH